MYGCTVCMESGPFLKKTNNFSIRGIIDLDQFSKDGSDTDGSPNTKYSAKMEQSVAKCSKEDPHPLLSLCLFRLSPGVMCSPSDPLFFEPHDHHRMTSKWQEVRQLRLDFSAGRVRVWSKARWIWCLQKQRPDAVPGSGSRSMALSLLR